MVQRATIVDCPTRPPCPACGMNMIEDERIPEPDGFEHCVFMCLRCGHVERSRSGKCD